MQSFTNPYINGDPSINLSKDDTFSRRVTYSVHDDDKTFIKTVRPRQGTETTAMCILYHKLVLACKARGITNMTHEKEFESFVANLELTTPTSNEPKPKRTRSASSKSNRQTPTPIVGGGTPSEGE
jgi:hypothetical protein